MSSSSNSSASSWPTRRTRPVTVFRFQSLVHCLSLGSASSQAFCHCEFREEDGSEDDVGEQGEGEQDDGEQGDGEQDDGEKEDSEEDD